MGQIGRWERDKADSGQGAQEGEMPLPLKRSLRIPGKQIHWEAPRSALKLRIPRRAGKGNHIADIGRIEMDPELGQGAG